MKASEDRGASLDLLSASARDTAAEQRDRAAEDRDFAAQVRDGVAAVGHPHSDQRELAARDREEAAEDRRQAASLPTAASTPSPGSWGGAWDWRRSNARWIDPSEVARLWCSRLWTPSASRRSTTPKVMRRVTGFCKTSLDA